MITTTLKKIRGNKPCANSWKKLLRHLDKIKADDEPLPLLTVLDSNGLADTLWCLRTLPEHDREWRLFAVWSARQVQHLMADPRSVSALDVAERYANGAATLEELESAWAAAEEAMREAAKLPPRDAVWNAAGKAIGSLWNDAKIAAREAACEAANSSAWESARNAASAVAWTAMSKTAWKVTCAAQEKRLREILTGEVKP